MSDIDIYTDDGARWPCANCGVDTGSPRATACDICAPLIARGETDRFLDRRMQEAERRLRAAYVRPTAARPS